MGKMIFGKEEKLVCLADVPLKGAEDEPLCLAHKTTKQFFVAGIYLSDDGYVLKIQGKDAFYPLPGEPELSQLQSEALLPKPLPPYAISTIDYLMGYSLWIIIGGMVAFYGAKTLLKLWLGRGSSPAPVPVVVAGEAEQEGTQRTS
jgi:hypothetical protein